MKNWPEFLSESLAKHHVKAQLRPGSHLWRIFIFSLVAAISIGVIYSFVNQYLGGTRAATEPVTATTGASKSQLAINEEFTINVLLSAADAKRISQLDLRLTYPTGGTNGGVTFIPNRAESGAVGANQTDYFDTIVLEESTPGTTARVRVVFSSTRQEAQLSNRVLVKIPFRATSAGDVPFTLDQQNMEIVGPGGQNVPTVFSIGAGSNTVTIVTINGQTPTATPGAGCYYQQVQCITAPCPRQLVCPSPSVTPVVSPGVPTVTPGGPTVTRPPATPTTAISPGVSVTRTPTVATTVTPTRPAATTVPPSTAPTSAVPTKIPSGGACAETAQCLNGYACMSGKCLPVLCDGQKVCPGGYSCKQGVCFPGTCNATNTCSNGYSCTNGVCSPSQCRADQPCAPGYTCQDNGTCVKTELLGQCSQDTQCKANGQCLNNNCFCKPDTYNCNRNWADGCEATVPCQGSGTARVTLRAKFNGIGVNIPPVDNTMKVNVMVANKFLSAPIEREIEFREVAKDARGISIYQGSFDLNNIAFGNGYSVFIKGEQHLQKRICDIAPKEAVDGRYVCTKGNITLKEGENILDFSTIYQLAGDIPIGNAQSGFIDSVDVVFIRTNFGSRDAAKLVSGDLNKDGIIDTQDYALALYALSFKYDEDITTEQ